MCEVPYHLRSGGSSRRDSHSARRSKRTTSTTAPPMPWTSFTLIVILAQKPLFDDGPRGINLIAPWIFRLTRYGHTRRPRWAHAFARFNLDAVSCTSKSKRGETPFDISPLCFGSIQGSAWISLIHGSEGLHPFAFASGGRRKGLATLRPSFDSRTTCPHLRVALGENGRAALVGNGDRGTTGSVAGDS